MTWHQYDESTNPPPRDRIFPAIDDKDRLCFVCCVGDEIPGGSLFNWRYYYESWSRRDSGQLHIKAWYEIPAYEEKK